jgi:hypothetical protein
MQKIKAAGIETFEFARRTSVDVLEWYRRTRENRLLISKKEPGPPLTVRRDLDEGTLESPTKRPS